MFVCARNPVHDSCQPNYQLRCRQSKLWCLLESRQKTLLFSPTCTRAALLQVHDARHCSSDASKKCNVLITYRRDNSCIRKINVYILVFCEWGFFLHVSAETTACFCVSLKTDSTATLFCLFIRSVHRTLSYATHARARVVCLHSM